MRHIFLIILIIYLPSNVMAQDDPDPVVTFDGHDPEMNAAIAAAQRTLPIFLSNNVDDEGYGPYGGYIKVGFPVENAAYNVEIIWVGPFLTLDKENFVGMFSNEPQSMPGQHAGDEVSFTYDMIVDWNLDRGDGRYYGDYTTRVVASRLPEDQAAALLSRFIEPPVPLDWTE